MVKAKHPREPTRAPGTHSGEEPRISESVTLHELTISQGLWRDPVPDRRRDAAWEASALRVGVRTPRPRRGLG